MARRLPGAGLKLALRLMAEIGDDRERFEVMRKTSCVS